MIIRQLNSDQSHADEFDNRTQETLPDVADVESTATPLQNIFFRQSSQIYRAIEGLHINDASHLRRSLQQSVCQELDRITRDTMEEVGLTSQQIAVVVSGGFSLGTSTIKSDVDIDVVSSSDLSREAVLAFEKMLGEKIISELDLSVDPYLSKDISPEADDMQKVRDVGLSDLYECGKLDQKRLVFAIVLEATSNIPRDVTSTEDRIVNQNLAPIGNRKAFLGGAIVGEKNEQVHAMIERTASRHELSHDSSYLEEFREILQRNLTSEVGWISPKVVANSMLKILSIEYQRGTRMWSSDLDDLLEVTCEGNSSRQEAVLFFVDYRLLEDNIRTLRSYSDLIIEDLDILQELAECCNCSSVGELKEEMNRHLHVLIDYVSDLSSDSRRASKT